MLVMFISAFFSWWYGQGWLKVANSFKPRLGSLARTFSVNQLLGTLFAPWRRIITYPGASLAERFRAWGDNIFSRTIGFIVRLLVLLAALIMSVVVSLLTLIELVAWPVIPIAIVGSLVIGILW